MSSFQLYLILNMDSFIKLFICLFVISTLIIIILLITWAVLCEGRDSEKIEKIKKIIKKHSKYLVPFSIFSLCLIFLIPSTKRMAAIFVIPKICNIVENNDQIKKLPKEIVSLASEWIEELHPKKTEKNMEIDSTKNQEQKQ